MQNKANLQKAEMSANLSVTKDYENYADFRHGKTKPIQSQFKPKQTQFKPIQSQFKANYLPNYSECLILWGLINKVKE